MPVSMPFRSRCFFSLGRNFLRTRSWWAWKRSSLGKPWMKKPCMAYFLFTISCDSAQNTSSSSFRYISSSAAI